jgi:zinc protease
MKRLMIVSVACVLAACVVGACQQQEMNDSGAMAEDAPSQTPGNAGGNATVPATVEEKLVDEQTRRVLRLTNGFTVILQQNKTAPVVAARVYVKAGALTEQQYMGAGISHVLEHLVAGASSGKRKEAENTLLLQQIGNDSNAYTDEDQTCYFITTSSEKWPVALDLLVDWTTNADFTREQFDREYKVVQRELEMDEAEADRTFYTHTQTTRYLFSPARHPVIGYKPAFQKLTFEDAKAYYKQMYVPDNMIVSVAGDIDLDAAEKMIVDQLKGIRRKAVPSIALPGEPLVAAPRVSVAHADVREARAEWAFPTINMYSPDLYAADVLAAVLGGSESSILVRKLRDEMGLASGVDVEDATPPYVEGQLTIDVVLPPEKIPAAQKAVLETLEQLLRDGIPADAIERAKARAAASLVYGDQTAEQQAIRSAQDFMNTGNIDYTKLYVERIQAVTPDQVLDVAKKYLRMDRMLTTVLLPLNAADPLAAAAKEAVSSAAVDTRFHKLTLKNGMTVLISQNPAAPLATFQLYTMGGLLAENAENNGIGDAMLEMMLRGTRTRSHQQITDFLDATGTTMGTEIQRDAFVLSATCIKKNEKEAFGVFADVALHPAFDGKELEQLRPQLLAGIEQSTEDWFDEAYKATRDAYFAASPYKWLATGQADTVAKLTPEMLRKHYESAFVDPKRTVLAIAGDIDIAEAEKWAQAFDEMSSGAGGTMLNMTSRPSGARTITRHTDKQSATIMFAYPPGSKATSDDRYALTLLQTYLGGYSSPGGSVLHETLRGKGLVYTVQASNIAGAAGGMFLISALGEPANVNEIVRNVGEIVERTKAGDIPDVQVAAAKDQAITGERLSRQTVSDKAATAAINEMEGLGYEEDQKFAERIKAVTKADMVRVANAYLNAPVVVITTPDAK